MVVALDTRDCNVSLHLCCSPLLGFDELDFDMDKVGCDVMMRCGVV